MNICGIYKITNPKRRIYIGQSKDIVRRRKNYEKNYCKDQVILHNSINKYGWDNHVFEIIEQCDIEELNQKEKYYIALYNTFNSEYGMNLLDGGGCGRKVSDETRRKLSEAGKRRKNTPFTIQKRANTMKERGYKCSEETKIKIGLANKGKKPRLGKKLSEESKKKIVSGRTKNGPFRHSEESKQKISKSQTGRKFSEEHRKRISISLTKYRNQQNDR